MISLFLSIEYRVLNWKLVSHVFPHREGFLEVRSTREIAISLIIGNVDIKEGKKEKRIWSKKSKLKEKSERTSSRGQEMQLSHTKKIEIILMYMLYWKRFGHIDAKTRSLICIKRMNVSAILCYICSKIGKLYFLTTEFSFPLFLVVYSIELEHAFRQIFFPCRSYQILMQ